MQAMLKVGRRHAVAILWSITMSGETNAAPPWFDLQPLAVPDAATVVSLMLVADPAPRLVLAHDTLPVGRRLVVMALAGGASVPVSAFRHKVSWSVAPAGSGSLQVAATDNSSAGSGLTWEGPAGRRSVINLHERFGVFDAPAFVRPARATPEGVAAVGLVDGDLRPVLFQPEQGNSFAPARPLPRPRPGVTLAVKLLRIGPGFVQATLIFEPGSEPRSPTDNPTDALLQGGLLECQLLTTDLRPAGRPWRPFADETVWEFEAMAVGDRPVMLASVANGLALAVGPATGGAPFALRGPFSVQLLSPALAAEGTVLHIAALAARGTPRAAVLLGRVSLS
jgi:hypothetical protein